MFAAAKPEPHRRMLDRFLVIAESNELTRASSSTRWILSVKTPRAKRFRAYERVGYPVFYTSVKDGRALG